jgi:ribosomal protein L22
MIIQELKTIAIVLLSKVCELEKEIENGKNNVNLGNKGDDLTVKEFAEAYNIPFKKCHKALRDLGFLSENKLPTKGQEHIFRVILTDGKNASNGHFLLNTKTLVIRCMAGDLANLVRKQV